MNCVRLADSNKLAMELLEYSTIYRVDIEWKRNDSF